MFGIRNNKPNRRFANDSDACDKHSARTQDKRSQKITIEHVTYMYNHCTRMITHTSLSVSLAIYRILTSEPAPSMDKLNPYDLTQRS